MSLKRYSKPQLAKLANELSIDAIGTKQILEKRILDHLDEHPELEEESDKYAKIFAYHRIKSPSKPSLESSSEAEVIDLEFEDEKTTEIVNGDQVEEEDDEEVEIEVELVERSEEEEEEEEEEDNYEDRELLEDEDDEDNDEEEEEDDDAEYVPSSFDLTKFQDCLIAKYECGYDFALEKFDSLSNKASKASICLKKKLSTINTVNQLTTAVELAILLYNQIPLVELQHASFLDQSICSKYYGGWSFIQSDLRIVDFSKIFEMKFVFTLLTWFFLSYALPFIGSYYFNFAIKKFKNTKYDPLSFNLIKLLLAYFFLNGNVAVSDVKNDIKVFAAEQGLLETSILNHLKAHLFHSSVVLRLILERLPFINGFIGILISLYVAVIGK